MSRKECDQCGLAECDLPDGFDAEVIFEACYDGCGQMLCQGCATMHSCGAGGPW